MKEPLIIIGVILAVLTAAILLISYICYRMTFRHAKRESDPRAPIKLAGYSEHKPRMDALIDLAMATPCEMISITARDGAILTARYYHVRDGAPLEIQVHGYKGHPMRDFCSGVNDSQRRGHNLILISQRSHAPSGGRCITFGVKERYDCLDWIDYAVSRFGKDVKIVLIGISMGAATVLMASGLDIPDNVKLVVADCPFSSPKAIIKKVIKDMKLPAELAFPFVRLGGLIYGGFDVSSASATDAVRHSRIPTVIIHGEGDTFVPCYMSEEIYAASDKSITKLMTFKNAEHGMSYFSDSERYLGEVESRMRELLGEKKG